MLSKHGYGVLGPKTGRLLYGYGVLGPKTGRLLHRYGVRGPKRAAFYTATGCAVQNGPPFTPRWGARSKTGRLLHGYGVLGSKTGRLLHRDGVRGPKRAAFFMPTACAAKTAGCFSQFLGAR